MCIIIVKQKGKKVSPQVLKTSSKINPHNLKGVVQFQAMVGGYVAVGSLTTGKLDSKNGC